MVNFLDWLMQPIDSLEENKEYWKAKKELQKKTEEKHYHLHVHVNNEEEKKEIIQLQQNKELYSDDRSELLQEQPQLNKYK